jgi:hypothetical protein
MSSKIVIFVGVLYLLLEEEIRGVRQHGEELLALLDPHFKGVVLQADLEHIAQKEGWAKVKQIRKTLKERGISVRKISLQINHGVFGEAGIVYAATKQLPILFAWGPGQKRAEAYALEHRLFFDGWDKARLKQAIKEHSNTPPNNPSSTNVANIISASDFFARWFRNWTGSGFFGVVLALSLLLLRWTQDSETANSEEQKISESPGPFPFTRLPRTSTLQAGERNSENSSAQPGNPNVPGDNYGDEDGPPPSTVRLPRYPTMPSGGTGTELGTSANSTRATTIDDSPSFTVENNENSNLLPSNIPTYSKQLQGGVPLLNHYLTWNGSESIQSSSGNTTPVNRIVEATDFTINSGSEPSVMSKGGFSQEDMLRQVQTPLNLFNGFIVNQPSNTLVADISLINPTSSSTSNPINNSNRQPGNNSDSTNPGSNSNINDSNNQFNSSFTSGLFTVGATGQVSIDYLFDGGAYQGELGVFSLNGLEQYEFGSQAFIQEVVQRVVSNSLQGHVVISDSTEGAQFSANLGWEPNFNSEDYKGIKAFSMLPNDKFGIVLIPNSTFRQSLNSLTSEGDKRPLFSLTTADQNDPLYTSQIADVTGQGHIFALEDQLIDQGSDRDYNDVIFQIEGATGSAVNLDKVINPTRDWRISPEDQNLTAFIQSTKNQLLVNTTSTGLNAVNYASSSNNLSQTKNPIPGQDSISNQLHISSGNTQPDVTNVPSLPPIGSQANLHTRASLQKPLEISYHFNPS